jgi:hypothetical protein
MITKELIALGKCLKELDVKALDEIEHRISFQKKIYLLWISGADLGYRFTWDRFGPYSKSLARTASLYTEHKTEIDEEINKFEFKGEFEAGIERAKLLIAKPPEAEKIPESAWVEILSSLHFLNTDAGRVPFRKERKEEIKKILLGAKPHLAEYEPVIDLAWTHLGTYLPNSSTSA